MAITTTPSRTELARLVRLERAELTAELRPLERRAAEIYERLAELDKADALLQGDW